jgi:hypothetical protein
MMANYGHKSVVHNLVLESWQGCQLICERGGGGVEGAQAVFTNHKKERKGLTTPSAMFTLSRLCAFSISCQRGFLPAAEHWARLVKRASNYSKHAQRMCAQEIQRRRGKRE